MSSVEVLTVPAHDLRPFDGIAEGTVIHAVSLGHVKGRAAVTVRLALAQIVAQEIDGHHLHDYQRGIVDERVFDWNEQVRVARPAPMAPCKCGFSPNAGRTSDRTRPT